MNCYGLQKSWQSWISGTDVRRKAYAILWYTPGYLETFSSSQHRNDLTLCMLLKNQV